MFNSLDQEIKRDERQQSTLAERMLQYIAVLFVSVATFQVSRLRGGRYACGLVQQR